MKPVTATKQAIIYTRVSTRNQEDNTSLASQLRECQRYADEHGLTPLECFSDVYSGAELHDRPELSAARELIRARRVQAIICYAIDRLARNFAHLAILAEEAERYGVELHFVSEPLDNSPEGRLIQSIKGYVAEIEREKIRERMQRGIRQKLQSGKFLRLGSDIYGYRFKVEKNQREIYEPEAAVVRDIFDWYLREQLGISLITKRLNERGVPTPYASKGIAASSKGWYMRTVNLMLRREEYAGKTFAGKYKLELKRNGDGKTYIHKTSQPPRLTMADSITPAIIPREIWEQVQQRLDTNYGAEKWNQKRFVLLRAMAHCGQCKKTLANVQSKKFRYYRCERENPMPGERCRVAIQAGRLDAEVWEAVRQVFNNPAGLAEKMTKRTAVDRSVIETARLQKDLHKINAGKERLLNLLRTTEDESLAASIQEHLRQQQHERQRVEEALNAVATRAQEKKQIANEVSNLLELSNAIKDSLTTLDEQGKRNLFEQLGLRVTVHPNKSWSITLSITTRTVSSLLLQFKKCNSVSFLPLSHPL